MTTQLKKELLDAEWVDLVKEAKKLGMSKEEIRAFLININK
ncbi:anti-repressor SinI family protein [Halobacillus rhizosphaerae]